ncbi:MAG: TMEM165/GDT1 family protein [Thermodesulfovibrionales bacterium]|nr:TMEM165/GDT1 family protein [Thermodesulfovibrionales bacterium]
MAFFTSLVFVVLAEIGDRTQLLAICFAARYPWQTVMWGVLWATAVNHLAAVALGNYLTTVFPINYIKIGAAISFIIFALWTLKGDKLVCEDHGQKFSPFWTVFIAFFIAEMGDKTQLATIALAADYNVFLPVWVGTTLGMVIANALGIFVGALMGKKIPERTIKWIAALIFMTFGFMGLYESLPSEYLKLPYILATLIIIGCSIYLITCKWTIR